MLTLARAVDILNEQLRRGVCWDTLYAAAARHWFPAAALMDKTKNDPATLVRYRESLHAGINPTPERRTASARA